MLSVRLGGDETNPLVGPEDSGEPAAGSRAFLRYAACEVSVSRALMGFISILSPHSVLQAQL